MAAITICSDFGAPKNKVINVSYYYFVGISRFSLSIAFLLGFRAITI